MSDSDDSRTTSERDLPEFEGQVLFKGNFNEALGERGSNRILDWIQRWRSDP